MRSINFLLDIPRIYGNMGMSADRIFISPALALIKIRLCVLGMQFSRYECRKSLRLVNTAGVEPAVCPLPDVFFNIFMKETIYDRFSDCQKSGSRLLSRAVSSKVPSAAQVLTVVFGMGTGVSPERIATGKFHCPLAAE